MSKQAAGILLYRVNKNIPEIFLCHPGGPFFKNKDDGAWTIPKGEFEKEEDAAVAAVREFEEETGQTLTGELIPLKPVKYKSGKIVFAWMVKGNADENNIKSNEFMLEWPPKSGKQIAVPEIDRAGWFTLDLAKQKILPSQMPFLIEFDLFIKKKI